MVANWKGIMKITEFKSRRLRVFCSQYRLAEASGVRRNRISLIECGYAKGTPAEIEQINKALDAIEANYIVVLEKNSKEQLTQESK